MAEPVSMATFYIISTLVSAGLNLFNGNKQRKLSEQATAQTVDAQRKNLEIQLEHQKKLQEKGYKEQIANQLRAYNLTNGWPLSTAPTDIAARINASTIMPLYCIIAPVAASGVQKSYADVWTNLSNFLASGFFTRFGNCPTIIQGSYKAGFSCRPNVDIPNIWEGLKSVPVLYMAPYSKEAEAILGVTIAMWGGVDTKTPPVPRIFEFDLHKLMIDETRIVTYDVKADYDRGIGTFEGALAENYKIFESEKEMLQKGMNFYDLDRKHEFYKKIKTVPAVRYAMMDKITPVLTTICSGLIDSHFVLTYGNDPLFPQMVKELCDEKQEYPDLLIRDCSSIGKPRLQLGQDFLKSLYTDYSRAIAYCMEPVAGVKNIKYIQEALPGCGDCFEKELANRWFPNDLAPEKFSKEQIKVLDDIAGVPGIKDTSYFSGLLDKRKALPSPAVLEEDAFSQAKKLLTEHRYAEAIPLLEKAAPFNPVAAYNLGAVYFNGDNNIEINYKKASFYFKKAAEGGVLKAFSLWANSEKKCGCSHEEFCRILKNGVENNDSDSACYLAIEYITNNKHLQEAESLLFSAANQGNEWAKEILQQINQNQNEGEFQMREIEKMSLWEMIKKIVEGTIDGRLFRKRWRPSMVERLSYRDLVAAARQYKAKYITAQRAFCVLQLLEDGTYQVLLTIKDGHGVIIKTDDEDIMANIFIAKSIDDKLYSLLNGKATVDFDILLD